MWNEKEVHWLDAGHNMWPRPLTSLVTLTLDVSRSNFEGIVGLIDVKWKQSELIWYWADCMTLPFDHPHDLDLAVEISRSESEIALSQEWDGWLTWNEKDVSHPFMTMILTSVTMVGWADVPDSDWGDFRRRRAVDISSYLSAHLWQIIFSIFATSNIDLVVSILHKIYSLPIPLSNMATCTQSMQRTWWPVESTTIVTGSYCWITFLGWID